MQDNRSSRITPTALTTFLLGAALLLSAATAGAYSGLPDATFGQDGCARLGFPGGNNSATAAAQQADGRIVVAGTGRNGGWAMGPLMLARYNADGSTDTSFGDGGFTFADLAITRFLGYAMLLQADGRIVIAGAAGGNTLRLAIARLNSDGSPDGTFNGSGYSTVPIMSGSRANAVGLLNGKYVVAGVADDMYANSAVAVVQFNDNGTLNTAFSGDGVVTTWVGSMAAGYALSFQTSVTQPTKIVVAGEANNGTYRSQFVILRYLPDGSLDTTFDSDGYSVVGASFYDSGARSVRVLYSGATATRIVAAGFSEASFDGYTREFSVIKLNLAGVLDATFDGDGIVLTTLGTNGATPSAMLTGSGRMTVIGTALNDNNTDIAMARYMVSDGSLDPAFDSDGKRLDDLGFTWSAAYDVAVQNDGGIIVAGSSFPKADYRFVAARFLPDGTPDVSFDADGRLDIEFGIRNCAAHAVLVEPDGRIVFGGQGSPTTSEDPRSSFLLTRREADGSADLSFGDNGAVTATDLEGGGTTALLRQTDGKLVAVGWLAVFRSFHFAAARFEADGQIDAAFGPNGNGFWSIYALSDAELDDPEPAAAFQPDGCIIIAGEAGGILPSRDVYLVRLTPDGVPDPTFGVNGGVKTAVGSGRDIARGVAVRPDGRIVVAGWTEAGAVTKAFVMRYMPDGTVDPSFGVGGHTILDLGDPSSASAAMALELQTDGTIVVAGDGTQDGNMNFAVARLTPHGAIDTSFGSSGRTLLDFPGAGEDKAVALALDAQGNAILAGSSLGNIAVARILNGPDASAVPGTSPGIAGLFLSAPSPTPRRAGPRWRWN